MTLMTYLEFHAAFVLLPLGLMAAVVTGQRRKSEVSPVAVAVVVGIALVYTTPWDNYLLGVGVWSYGEGTVAGVLWRAPLEEYLFIVLQPVLAALWLHWLTAGSSPPAHRFAVTRRTVTLGALAGTAVGLAGLVLLFAGGRTFYLGAILAWAGPVLAVQWAVGWPYLLARRQALLAGLAGPALYLAAADRFAIDAGVWRLSADYTTGVGILGLPVEEALFFLVTTLFVVQALLLYPWVRRRLA